jgi:hypothetical protein
MKRILFVKGFNVSKKDYHGHNVYVYFDIFFKLSNYKLDYFEYNNDEDLNITMSTGTPKNPQKQVMI